MGVVEQAGGIVFRPAGREISILLVRAKRSPESWIFPKGHIEPGETAAEAALRETHEEAGVNGELIGPAGKPIEFKWGGDVFRVRYFVIRLVSESPDTDGREKAWFAYGEALARLSFDNTRLLLRQAWAAIEKASRR